MKHHNPILVYTRQLFKNRSIFYRNTSPEIYKRVFAWYIKSFVTEPFRWYEIITRDRQIKNHELDEPPLFILGHWRSGTSFLQTLLTRDPARGFLHKYASVFPESFLSSEPVIKPLVRKITERFETKQNISKISVSWEWETPGELDIAMITMFSPYSLHWGHVFPADKFDYYMEKYAYFNTATEEEEIRWKETCRYLINKVSVKNDKKQLIIKSPANTARIEQLLDLYPNAKFVYIHRNPFDVFYSNLKMWNVILDNLSFQQISRKQIIENILITYRKLLSSYLEQRSFIPKGNLIELRYETFIEDPIVGLNRIYNRLSLEGFDNALPAFRQFLGSQENKSGSYQYEPEIVSRIEKEWQFSLREWPYDHVRSTRDR